MTHRSTWPIVLQTWGSRTTITAAQLAANQQRGHPVNIIYVPFAGDSSDAPWACGVQLRNLNFIPSVPAPREHIPCYPTLARANRPRLGPTSTIPH